jgi:hypothetical protein
MQEPQDQHPESASDALDAAKKRMTDLGASLAELAENLHQAVAAGTVPPNASTRLATHLEDLATRMATPPVTEPTEPEGESR